MDHFCPQFREDDRKYRERTISGHKESGGWWHKKTERKASIHVVPIVPSRFFFLAAGGRRGERGGRKGLTVDYASQRYLRPATAFLYASARFVQPSEIYTLQ